MLGGALGRPTVPSDVVLMATSAPSGRGNTEVSEMVLISKVWLFMGIRFSCQIDKNYILKVIFYRNRKITKL